MNSSSQRRNMGSQPPPEKSVFPTS